MIGTSAVLQEEFSHYYIIPELPFLLEEKKEEILGLTDLELLVTDSVSGRPISNAMVSIDSISHTAVCDEKGKALIQEVLPGDFILDVIVWGYIASTTRIRLSGLDRTTSHIKMIRNC